MPVDNLARHVDRDALRFLRAVEYHGGNASMTQIRQRTGLSRDAANHRFQRLEELDLIDVTYAEEGYGDRHPPKVAHLTGVARREIERGLFQPLDTEKGESGETVDIQAELGTMQDQLDQHDRRLDSLSASDPSVDHLSEQVEAMETRLDELEDYIYEWHEAAETYLRGLRAALEANGIDVEPHFREAQDATTDE
ncbi:winged helix-turn-helix domain-containing protein [Halobacterium yunchengense]|uniref:winged helix-turn-helix domain-containing protein n=1 Tax=Halobacterium yunchengense TaxID=3108497 RepID=UPI00300B20B5